MRNKNFDADLLKTLNEQPMPAAPLTDVYKRQAQLCYNEKNGQNIVLYSV